MNRLIDCLALFTHCEPRFFGNPKTCLNANVQWVYSFLSVSWFPTCPPFFAPDVLQLLLPCRWVEQSWPHPSSAVSTRCFLKKPFFLKPWKLETFKKKRKGFFRFQGVSWWIFRKWAGKSTRKGPERASIFEPSPVVSSRNQLPKDMVHSVSRSMTSSFSLWRSKAKLLFKILKVLKYYKKPMGLNFKPSKIQDISYNYPTIRALNPNRSWRNVSPKDGPPNS